MSQLERDGLVAAWSAHHVTAWLQHYTEFAGIVFTAFAFRNLTVVELVENPDTFADYTFREISAWDSAARESVDA